jgi:hypothetical protein
VTRPVDGEPRIRDRAQLWREIHPTPLASPTLICHGRDPRNQASCQDSLLTPERRWKSESTTVARLGLLRRWGGCEGCRVAGSIGGERARMCRYLCRGKPKPRQESRSSLPTPNHHRSPMSRSVARTTTDRPVPMDRGNENSAEIAADAWVPYVAARCARLTRGGGLGVGAPGPVGLRWRGEKWAGSREFSPHAHILSFSFSFSVFFSFLFLDFKFEFKSCCEFHI